MIIETKIFACDSGANEINSFLSSIVNIHFWHNELLELYDFGHHLMESRCDVGDSMDDEWFIVYCMLEVSKRFDCFIR